MKNKNILLLLVFPFLLNGSNNKNQDVKVKKRISKNILFTIQGENILYSVNKELFSWVIENLFKNSIDAIGESGKIKIVLHKKSNKILGF